MADDSCSGSSQLIPSDGICPWNIYPGALCDDFELKKINDGADTESDDPNEGSEICPSFFFWKVQKSSLISFPPRKM